MQLIYSLNLKAQNERDRKADRLADDWLRGKRTVKESLKPVEPEIDDELQAFLDAIEAMQTQ